MSEKKVGFVAMAAEKGSIDNIPEIGVGMIGHSFMGKAHSNGWKKMPYIFWPPPAIPKLVKICGIPEDEVSEAAKRFGYAEYTTDWKELVSDDRIQVVNNCTPNCLHADPSIEAAKNGKHVICEKPLTVNAKEAKRMLDAVTKAGVKHICNYNYRGVPAIVLAKHLIDDGKLGQIFHFRARYLQEWIVDPDFPLIWRLQKDVCGSGAIGDLGSHIIDLARMLCGEPKSLMAATKTFIEERPMADDPSKKGKVNVDDAFEAIFEFENGAIGTIEASRFCPGRKNFNTLEINAEKGSIWWDLENLNNLHVYFKDEDPEDTRGFHKINVTESYHPYFEKWWPHGHIIGWENTFVHTMYNMANAIINDAKLDPLAATFEDGYKNAVICDAILESSEAGKKVDIVY